jgi:hypothetical protein
MAFAVVTTEPARTGAAETTSPDPPPSPTPMLPRNSVFCSVVMFAVRSINTSASLVAGAGSVVYRAMREEMAMVASVSETVATSPMA